MHQTVVDEIIERKKAISASDQARTCFALAAVGLHREDFFSTALLNMLEATKPDAEVTFEKPKVELNPAPGIYDLGMLVQSAAILKES